MRPGAVQAQVDRLRVRSRLSDDRSHAVWKGVGIGPQVRASAGGDRAIAYSGWNGWPTLRPPGRRVQPQACRNLGGDLDASACQADDDAGANPTPGSLSASWQPASFLSRNTRASFRPRRITGSPTQHG